MTKSTSSRPKTSDKEMLHARNRHRERYDFPALIAASTALKQFVKPSGHGHDSIDFSDPRAVKSLNQALLRHYYGISEWDIPEGYLCPPIPGRADYIHHAADLLGAENINKVPRGPGIRVVEVGVGASCVYPIIGAKEYGWSFVGTDIDRAALRNAQKIVTKNPAVLQNVEFRLPPSPDKIFNGVITAGERFDLTMCNPPFHATLEEVAASTRRKVKNLHGSDAKDRTPNFGGLQHELWCRGGELGFVTRMIKESVAFAKQCLWFTSLLSKQEHLNAVDRGLKNAGAVETRVIGMAQGQKKSRIVAWTYLSPAERKAWSAQRFGLGSR